MTSTQRITVCICFEEDAPREAQDLVLKALGFSNGPNQWCRWFEAGLLVVQLQASALEHGVLDRVEKMSFVRRVFRIPGNGGLVARENGGPDSIVWLPNGATFGGTEVTVIAGPCSVESESQVCEIAAHVKEAGAKALRGGVFKPRSSPYSFGGLGEKGLEHLAKAREETGLPVVSEALEIADIDVVARYADVIQIGSRNMANFPLLFKVGSHPSGKPILLKRSFGATIDEFLLSAEYILLGRLFAGHDPAGVILCERGIRTFETSTRFTLDVGAFPVIKERTRLPIIADPSHPAGFRRFVPPLARAAVAAGADGLLVEVHVAPDASWCDASQALGPADFRKLMDDVRSLESLRAAVPVEKPRD